MVKKLIVLLIILSTLFTTSCWDLIDIERRAFVVGIGIDKAEKSEEIEVIFQIALPDAFTREGGGDTESFWNITITAPNFIQARKKLIRYINWVPTLEHCKILIFGEEYAKGGLEDPLDFFLRTHDVRRLMLIGVTDKVKASDIMNLKLKNNRIPSMFISDLLTGNSTRNYGILDNSYIGILHEKYITNSSMPIAKIRLLKDNVLDASGSGILDRDHKLIGWFDANNNMALGLFRGEASAGYLGVELPERLGGSILLNIFGTNSDFKPEFRGDKLYAVLKVKLEGDIVEIGIPGYKIESTKTIKDFEVEISKKIIERIYNTFEKAQNDLNSDPFGLDAKVMNYYPEYWSSIKNNWEDVFKSVELDVQVETRIRRIGDINY